MTRFGSLDAAQARVDILRRSGIWPGIRCHHDGTYTLTFDLGDNS